MKSGVYDISNEEYHSGEGFSRSKLVAFNRSPLHFWHEALNPEKEQEEAPLIIKQTNAKEYGNALHTYVLEPPKFCEEYYITPKINRATKKGKEEFKEHQEKARGKLLICEEAFKSIAHVMNGLSRHKQALTLLADAQIEKSIYWTDPDTGIQCKVRPDVWHSNMIVDLKTTVDASQKSFQRSIFQFAYHIQAGMIQEALRVSQGIHMENFVYLAVEKQAPYASAIYMLSPEIVSQGVAEFKNILIGIKECMDSGHWPSYPTAMIDMPSWMVQQ